jgi:hypothetical protein
MLYRSDQVLDCNVGIVRRSAGDSSSRSRMDEEGDDVATPSAPRAASSFVPEADRSGGSEHM